MQTLLFAVRLALLCAGLPQVVPAAAAATVPLGQPDTSAATALDSLDCTTLGSPAHNKTVLVPAGIYRPFFKSAVGEASKSPPQPVKVAAFRLDAAAVTRGEFLRFVCQHPEWRKSQVKQLFAEESYLGNWAGDLDAGSEPLDQPVTQVSWFAARAFCAARNARLPTLAEWERAAGGSDAIAAAQAGDPTNGGRNPFQFAMGRPAADLQGSGLAFGRVWEWTSDFNSVAAGNSRGGRSSLFCGDGFRSNNAGDYAAFLRYSFRSSLRGNYSLKNLGFRCAGDVAR
jgi:formylglycine-generating enzyme